MTAVEAARSLAGQIWRRERPHPQSISIKGLNGEEAVRRRLHKIAGPFTNTTDWMHAPISELSERSESLCHVDPKNALYLVVIQSLAARLGSWIPTEAEIADAAIAHRLYADLGAPEFSRYRLLQADALRLRKAGRYEEALRLHLDADRLVRTAPNLVDAAVCLERLGDHRGTLWAIRAALLEPPTSFGDERTLWFTERLRERLTSSWVQVQTRDIEMVLDVDQAKTQPMIELAVPTDSLPTDDEAMRDAFIAYTLEHEVPP